jgi:aminomethyltransferase
MTFDPTTVRRDYGDPELEAQACRTDCALFDFSFIARARIRGAGALDVIGHLTRRPLTGLLPGQIRYALREDSSGHLISDLTVWRHDEFHYEVMSGRLEDIMDLVRLAGPDCAVDDLSAQTSIFAVQGPGSLRAVAALTDIDAISRLRYFTSVPIRIGNADGIIARLGYTGEPGFEIILPRSVATEIWQSLAQRARPAGFAAADMLRIEAGLVLFANEFRLPVTAGETGLNPFAGPARTRQEPELTLVCFQANTRERTLLWHPRAPVVRPAEPGTITVTSACHSLQAGGTLALGFALRSDVAAKVPLRDPTGTFADVRLAPLPFYDPSKRRPRLPWSASLPET